MKVTTLHPDGTRTTEEVPDIDMSEINRKMDEEKAALRNAPLEPLSHYQALTDRELVVACIHWNGTLEHLVGDDLQWSTYCEGDGYGYLDGESLSEINEGWDWSHVRDSTPEGWKRMADNLRRFLPAIIEGPTATNGRRTL